MSTADISCDTYAVFGNPIAHSKSPLIHTAFARQTGQRLVYRAQLVARGGFVQALQAFQDAGGKGLNVTVPFKQDAWAAMDRRAARADKAGAVNTVWFDAEGRKVGDNTDGVGLVRDIAHNHARSLRGQEILLLGAGGAARGVLGPVLAEGPARVVIANRTPGKAEELAALFGEDGAIRARGYPDLAGQAFDIVINATSAGLQGELPPLPDGVIKPGGLGYDMLYGARPTPFVRWTLDQGAQALDGLGMLVEQAAEAFFLWRGVRPDSAPVIRELRETI